MANLHLLIIDPQNDFCDPAGALAVAGAQADMSRLANLVQHLNRELDCIHVTLDSHHYFDIAHPAFWVDAQGKNPSPFTILSAASVETGIWKAALPECQAWALDYTRQLATNRRYALCIWPPHCLIGSWGTQVTESLQAALQDWEMVRLRTVDYIYKGANYLTEHYSAIRADVFRPDDPSTGLNRALLDQLQQADRILIAGEAQSHCVRFTTQDLIDNLPPGMSQKIVVLKDAMSPVTGFEAQGREFLDWVESRGVTITTTDRFLA